MQDGNQGSSSEGQVSMQCELVGLTWAPRLTSDAMLSSVRLELQKHGGTPIKVVMTMNVESLQKCMIAR